MGTTAAKLQGIVDSKAAIVAVFNELGISVPQKLSEYAPTLRKCFRPFSQIYQFKGSGGSGVTHGPFEGDVPYKKVSLPCMGSGNRFGTDAFRNNTTLEEVDLPTVTSTEPGFFAGCTNLKTISMPALQELNEEMFGYKNEFSGGSVSKQLTKLVSLSLPALTAFNGSVFGYYNSQEGRRYYFTGIEDLYIPNKTETQIKEMPNYIYITLSPTCKIHASDNTFTYGMQDITSLTEYFS